MKMKHRIGCLLALAVAVVTSGGCTADHSPAPEPSARLASSTQHAECLVCKANADLACVDVGVDAKTPTYVLDGRTYYFCSDECRDKFQKNPAKHTGK